MRRKTATLAATMLLTGAVLAGCGDGDGDSEEEHERESKQDLGAAADRSVCAADAKDDAKQAPYDEAFPTAWTFPPATVVYSVEDREGAGVIVTGVTTDPFDKVLSYLNDQVTADGITFIDGETEEDDAESNWTSTGYTGRWAIRSPPTATVRPSSRSSPPRSSRARPADQRLLAGSPTGRLGVLCAVSRRSASRSTSTTRSDHRHLRE